MSRQGLQGLENQSVPECQQISGEEGKPGGEGQRPITSRQREREREREREAEGLAKRKPDAWVRRTCALLLLVRHRRSSGRSAVACSCSWYIALAGLWEFAHQNESDERDM